VTAYLIEKEVPPESIQIEESQNDQGKFEYELEAELLENMAGNSPDSVAGVD